MAASSRVGRFRAMFRAVETESGGRAVAWVEPDDRPLWPASGSVTVIAMRSEPTCPRCAGPLRAPSVWSSVWACSLHGPVEPVQPLVAPSSAVLHAVSRRSAVPVWIPWPLPPGYVVTGLAHAGDDRTGPRATAVACTGPAPLGGAGEIIVVAEEPGTGLAAHLAGLAGPDPGDAASGRPPEAKVMIGGHPTALWLVHGAPADRSVYVGEAFASWLWVLLWPPDGDLLLDGSLGLLDLREVDVELDLPFGALSPRLSG